MATKHHDQKGTTEKVLSIKPIKINSVKIVEIEKIINVPVFKNKEVEVERPVYIEKVINVPVFKEIELEKPVYINKEYEKPVITEVEKIIEIPCPVEKPYDMPVPNEIPYDLPVVSMKQVKEIAAEATMVLVKAQGILKEVNATVETLNATVSEIKENLPKEIKMPKIVEEEMIIKKPKLVYETVKVIGKIIARDE